MKRAQPWLILALAGALVVFYARPGYMSTDSVSQLLEARSGQFSNAHPPLLSAIWSVLDRIVAGPLLMLLLQLGAVLAGLYVLLGRVLAPRAAAIAAAALVVFPPIMTPMAVIWKDSQMAAFLVAGTAALSRPGRARWLGLALVMAACGFRYNAAAAGLPLVALLFAWRPEARGARRYGAALLAFVVVFAAALGIGRALTFAPSPSPAEGLAVTDISGVLAFGRDVSDAELRARMPGVPLRIDRNVQAAVRARYTPRNSYFMNHGDDRVFEHSTNDVELAAYGRAWKTTVLDQPGAYLRHRVAVFAALLGFGDDELWSPVYNKRVESAEQAAQIGDHGKRSRAQRWIGERLQALATTPLYFPYVYALLALVLLVGFARDRLSIALLASGLCYELGFFPTTSTPDYRYSHWMIASACIALVLIIARRVGGSRPATRAADTPGA